MIKLASLVPVIGVAASSVISRSPMANVSALTKVTFVVATPEALKVRLKFVLSFGVVASPSGESFKPALHWKF
jgi:hypothetical protein